MVKNKYKMHELLHLIQLSLHAEAGIHLNVSNALSRIDDLLISTMESRVLYGRRKGSDWTFSSFRNLPPERTLEPDMWKKVLSSNFESRDQLLTAYEELYRSPVMRPVLITLNRMEWSTASYPLEFRLLAFFENESQKAKQGMRPYAKKRINPGT